MNTTKKQRARDGQIRRIAHNTVQNSQGIMGLVEAFQKHLEEDHNGCSVLLQEQDQALTECEIGESCQDSASP